LDFSENPLSDACADAIAGAFAERRLEEVDLSRTDVGPRGAASLADAVCLLATQRGASSTADTTRVVVRLSKGARIPEKKASSLARKVDAVGNGAIELDFKA
jgi:hypothetical protein